MFKKLLVGVIAVAAVAGLIGIAAALFTSQKIETGNAFTAGTVVLNTAHAADVLVTLKPMAPGDQVTAPITVTNNGTLELRYDVTSVATVDAQNLAGQLDLTIREDTTSSGCTDGGFASYGSSVYTANDLGDAIGITVVPSRTLAADGGSKVLCLNIKLPLSTDDAFQGAVTTATLTFNAVQTKNNPTP
jgi:spore coat-associated protein N